MTDKWSALRANPSRFEFMSNKWPKCPHCGNEVDANEHELWQLYEEKDQDIDCPHCGQKFHVQVHVSYSYSTDDQLGEDEEDEEPEEEDESPYCGGCNPEPTISELESGYCYSCGKELA